MFLSSTHTSPPPQGGGGIGAKVDFVSSIQPVDTLATMTINPVPDTEPRLALKTLIERITRDYPTLSPRLQLAALRILDHTQDVALKSMRALAVDAKVPPSTMLRLARATGFASYESFRQVFQDALRSTGSDFVTRAQWLQQLQRDGAAGGVASGVVSAMAAAVLGNVEAAYRGADLAALAAAADLLRVSQRVHVVGVGGMHPIAAYGHYVARMALPDVRLAEPVMAAMIDELADLTPEDAVLLLSVAPYASETVKAAEFAASRGARLVILTDSRISPVAPLASALILVPTATPLFFPSQVATLALLETLIALTVSHGDEAVLQRIERIDRHRREQGIYWRPK